MYLDVDIPPVYVAIVMCRLGPDRLLDLPSPQDRHFSISTLLLSPGYRRCDDLDLSLRSVHCS